MTDISAPLQITHILTSLNPGGIATQVRNLIGGLTQHDIHSNVILTLDHGAVADILAQEGIAINHCYYHGREEIAWSYRVGKVIRHSYRFTFRQRLAKLLKTLRPDVVHSFMHGTHWVEQLTAAHRVDAPFLMYFESPSSPFPQTRQAQRFTQQLQPGDRLLGVGPGIYEAYQDYLSAVPAAFIAHPGQGIPNSLPDPGPPDESTGQAIRQQLGIPDDAFVVGSIGRLIVHKQYSDLLVAAAQLKDIHVLLVGDGSERVNLEQQTATLGLSNRVHFVGFQTNPADWLNAMDCYVLLSLFEGLPVALVEAMAHGLPIVATDVLGTRDVITNEQNGLLVPLNDITAIVGAIVRVMQSDALRMRLGHAARNAFLARYQMDETVRSFAGLYREMIAERRANRG